MTANAPTTDNENDIKYCVDSALYAKGTLGFGTEIRNIINDLPDTMTVVEYGTIFMRDALRTTNGTAYNATANPYTGELEIGYSNTINQKTYYSIYISRKVMASETVPDYFVAVLKDVNAANGNVCYGYYITRYASRSFIRCYDRTTGVSVIIYGNTVVQSSYELNPNLGITG